MKFRSMCFNLLQVYLYDNTPQETQAPDSLKRRLSKQPHILIQKITAYCREKNQVHSNHKSYMGTRNQFVFSVSSLQWKALTSPVNTCCQQCSQPLRRMLNVWLIVNPFDNCGALSNWNFRNCFIFLKYTMLRVWL